MSRYIAIRAVNGYGARCGCGGASKLHLARPRDNVYSMFDPATSIFLCRDCVVQAIDVFMAEREQDGYWPGDEDRDEPYVDPRVVPTAQQNYRQED